MGSWGIAREAKMYTPDEEEYGAMDRRIVGLVDRLDVRRVAQRKQVPLERVGARVKIGHGSVDCVDQPGAVEHREEVVRVGREGEHVTDESR